jgi:diguanylate cyclase (GGDEF)-like protein
LGIFAFIIGSQNAESFILNKELEKTAEELLNSKKELEKYAEALEIKNKELCKNACTDPITGMKNKKELLNIPFHSKNIVLYVLNISYFREINSIFGYEVGNQLLKQFGERLVENGYNVYKLDGDEFAIIDFEKVNHLELDVFANYIFEMMSGEAFKIGKEDIYITIKLGIAIQSADEVIIDDRYIIQDLIYDASYALKYAKKKKQHYAIYNEELKYIRENQDNFNWKKKIINGIRNNKFIAFYQPIISNKNGEEQKYETLIRMTDEEGNILSPYKFIAASKKYNLYNYLTRFVFLEACEAVMSSNFEISINISIDDIRDMNTRKLIMSKLKEFPKAPRLVFELLESEGIDNYREVRDFIKMVKQYNCKVSIDDFGSGYSNFEHILNLDIDYIKIDASLIKNIDTNKNSQYLVKTIVDFANSLGIKTIAEYVHSKEVQEKVKAFGIDYSQGYYFGEPKRFICRT